MTVLLIKTITEISKYIRTNRAQRILAREKNSNKSKELDDSSLLVTFIPTMGALHSGHLSLVEECHKNWPKSLVVVSIFVNPLQFARDGLDLQRYPRNLNQDLELLRKTCKNIRNKPPDLIENPIVVFAPDLEEIYPSYAGREIRVGIDPVVGSAARYEGRSRAGHFDGVLTVVAKLFNIVQPDIAVFGQKDAEQVFLIRRMIKQLNFPVLMHVAETVREPDGLAMSSRNSLLSPEERKISLCLYAALCAAKRHSSKFGNGALLSECLEEAKHQLLNVTTTDGPSLKLDYLVVVDEETMEEIPSDGDGFHGRSGLVLIAATIGKVRLIDNILIKVP